METSELSAWDSCCTSQLKIVLLGGRNSGKSCVGNLILGKEEFVTKERTSCSRRLGVVSGRWLTVVDTPGWWCDFSAQDTCELVKREIVSSASLCSAGPHAFLVVVKASSAFSEKRRRAVEEHVALLGEKVWRHCVVVFTFTDNWRLTKAEELVDRVGTTLRWLSDKCSQRCHSVVLNDDTEVPELLVKIQKLVTGNGNREFEMQESIAQKIADDKRRVEERAQQRFMKMKEHRALMRERLWPITDIRIVLLGAKGSGKTSAFNTILGKQDRTAMRRRRTARCVVGEGVVFGRQVTVVDTPGWWRNYFCDESPVFDQREMVLSLSLCPPGPHVFLLVIRVDRAFTETYRRAAQEHIELISEHIWSRVIVMFSFGDWLGGTTTEQYIESEGKPLQWLVERCGNRYHLLNNKTKGDGFQVRELIGKIEEMVAGCSSNWHYEIERSVIEKLEGRMRGEQERAKERMMKKEKQRQMARSQLEKLRPLSELTLVLVGGRKTGKSSCGNTILSRESLDADTRTTFCTEKQSKVNGKMVTVLDTPGCFSVPSDLLLAPSPCAILLVVNVSSAFTDVHIEAVEQQLEAGGGQVWSRAVVLFSFGDWLGDTSVEQRIESEGRPLQRLVDKCGRRYHVLDNKHRDRGAQVKELIELIEEMLAEERLGVFHRGDDAGRSVSSRQEQQVDATTLREKDSDELTDCRCQLSHDLSESASSTPPLICSKATAASGQIVALPAGRTGTRNGFLDSGGFVPCLASMVRGKERLWWTETDQVRLRVNLPVWFLADDPHGYLFSPRRPTAGLFLPQVQAEENVNNVRCLCRPALRDRTLRRLTESGGLQALIDRWGDSSLEELEAFIDSYFQMVWEQTMESCRAAEPDSPAAEQGNVTEQRGEDPLSSINDKLSKLDLLEEIRVDLAELRQSLEQSLKTIQDLREKSKQGPQSPC